MIKSSCFFLLYRPIAILCFIASITEVKPYENALVFDPVNQKLVELNDEVKIYPTTYLLACPSSTLEQQLLDDYVSVSGKGMYVHSIKIINSEAASKVQETNVNICTKKYKPVMVQDTGKKSYETGYELYYENEQIALQCEKYDQFKKVTNRETNKEKFHYRENIVEKTKENGNTIFHLRTQSTTKWAFYWISVLSIQVFGQQRQIRFIKDQINKQYQLHRTMFMCEDYSLEDHSHIMPSQKWVKYQKKSKEQPKDANIVENTSHKTDFGLDEIQVMPMRYFHTFSARLATCTYFNLAYVVRSIAVDQVEKVDLYLYSMYRAWPSAIDIIFGVTGTSNEISHELLEKISNTKSERLRKFPIPVPEIIYRIVEYNVDGKMYNAIVVIHNNIGSVSKKDRICPPEFELQGWNDLGQGRTYQGFNQPSGLTYTCPVTSDTIQKLDVKYENTSIGSFNLNENLREEILKQRQIATLETSR